MSHLPDDQLAAHLRRRAASAPFDDETRHQLAVAIHEQVAATPRRGRAFGRPLLRWATAAVAAVVLVALGAGVLSRLDMAPGPAAPSPPATWGVLSADELAVAFTSGDFAGSVVMADARLLDVSVSPCPRLALCTRPVIAGHPEIVVEMESGPNVWPGLRAFRIEADRLVHLGAVELPDEPRAWTVPDMLELVPPVTEGEAAALYPVLGWLSVGAHSCARPIRLPGAPEPLPEAWCRAAWLTDSPFQPTSHGPDGTVVKAPTGHALRVQGQAYADFSGQPDEGGDPRPPTKGLYLVRRAPCPADMADCSLWEVVGRINTLGSDAEASPPPGLATPTPGPPNNLTPEANQSAIVGAVAEWLERADGELPAGTMYVEERIGQELVWYAEAADIYPEVASAGPAAFGNVLTAEAKLAIQRALGGGRDLAFVTDRASAIDMNASEMLPCRPYLFSRSMLRLGAPHHLGRDEYLIEVNLDRGCEGKVFLLKLNLTDRGYLVTEVVAKASWRV